MAFNNIPAYDATTPGNNTDIGGVSIAEGWPAANINNSIRQLLTQLKQYLANAATVASSGTIDLGAQTANAITISGTTTITSFGTVAAGTWKDITFSGAMTLTYNATSMILPTAANITTVAGDTARFVSLGSGNWKCLYYYLTSGLPLVAPTVTIPPTIPVRQTVLSGPLNADGSSNFGGSTGSTTVTATGTLIATAANGFSATGATDLVGSITNPSWTSLSTNGTIYLGLTIAANGTCTTSATTAPVVYEWNGTPSTSNNVFTYNIQQMMMMRGNGSTAPQTYTVFVGEVTVAAGVVSAITWYPLMGRYLSGYTNTLTSTNVTTTFNHNLGSSPSAAPLKMALMIKCLTAELGFSIGHVMLGTALTNNGTSVSPHTLVALGNQMSFKTGANQAWAATRLDTGAFSLLTAANWAYQVSAERGW